MHATFRIKTSTLLGLQYYEERLVRHTFGKKNVKECNMYIYIYIYIYIY